MRAVSFREVARRAGVSHQTPYHHFGDHLGILREIAREGFTNLMGAMQGAAAAVSANPESALCAAGLAYVKFARAHPGHFRVMFQARSFTAPGESIPEGQQTFQTLVGLVDTAHRAGLGRGLSVETLSRLAWSTVHGLAVLMIEGTMQTKSNDAAARDVVSAFARLLRAT